MDISGPLGAHCCFPDEIFPIGRLVIVAQENSRVIWQFHQAVDRLIQPPCVSAGKVSTRGTVVGHEHSVAHECCVPDDIGHISWRVPWNAERNHRNRANFEALTIDQQRVELRAVACETRSFVEYLAKDTLNRTNFASDSEFSADLLLQIWSSRKMVCMGVGFKQPFYSQAFAPDVVDDPVRRFK